MHHALRDTLMVEVEDLFAEVEVLEQRRAAKTHLKRIEIVRDRPALRSGHHRNRAGRRLVQLSAGAAAACATVPTRARRLPQTRAADGRRSRFIRKTAGA